MKRQAKRLVHVALLGTAILSLSACVKSGANQATEKTVSFIKDAQSSNQRIWFMANSEHANTYELSKDTHIDQILVTKNGKATVYNTPTYTFLMRDIDGKSDKKIISMAKVEDKKYYHETIQKSKDGLQERIDSDKGILKNNTFTANADERKDKQRLESDIQHMLDFQAKFPVVKYEKPTAKPLRASVVTDNSGNNVVQENIIHQRIKLDDKVWNYKFKEHDLPFSYPENMNLTMSNVFSQTYDSPVKILSSMYVGYTNETNNQPNIYLITKTTNKDAKSVFDSLKTKKVTEAKG